MHKQSQVGWPDLLPGRRTLRHFVIYTNHTQRECLGKVDISPELQTPEIIKIERLEAVQEIGLP